MKRAYLCVIPLVAVAACGGAGDENKAKGKAERLQPGQYEVTAEVTNFKAADKGTPKIETKQGTSTTRSVCVPEGATPPAELFIDEGFSCRSGGDLRVRNGSINANLDCTGTGLSGQVGYAVSGTFTADSFEAERQLKTRLSTDGDVEIASNIRGRRTGECSAAPAAAAEKAK